MSIQRALEITGWPEWESRIYSWQLYQDDVDDGWMKKARKNPASHPIQVYHLSDHEAHALIERHFMDWLVDTTGPVEWEPTAVDRFAWLGILLDKHAADEKDLLEALQQCICAIDAARETE